MSGDPKSFNDPGRKTLDERDIEGVGSAVLALLRELWVVIDRVAVIEQVLAARGIDIRQDIENFTPSSDFQKRMDDRGTALVDSVLKAMAGMDGEGQ